MIKTVKLTRLGGFLLILGLCSALLMGSAMAADITYNLAVEKIDMRMPDGELIPMWGFALADSTGVPQSSATVPGPMLTATAGDNVTINLFNNLTGAGAESVSLIIPGQAIGMTPVYDANGRVVSFTSEAAAGGGSISYTWSGVKPGTFLYQSGTHQAVQIQMGLYGCLKVDAAVGVAYVHPVYGDLTYAQEAVMLYSEIDPDLHNAVATGNYGPGQAMTSTIGYAPKYFLLNGKPSSPATSFLPNDAPGTLLVRFLNAGLHEHFPLVLGQMAVLIAEGGNLYPHAKLQNSLFLPAGETLDVGVVLDGSGPIAVLDQSLKLTYMAKSYLGIFQSGAWYLDLNKNGTLDDTPFYYGMAGDTPVMGDWNGDGAQTVGIARGGMFFLRNSNSTGFADVVLQYGLSTDWALAGDWDGDGTDTVGIYRGGSFFLRNSNTTGVADLAFGYGLSTDWPVVGDWNGDGVDTVGVFREGIFYLRNSNTTGFADLIVAFGSPGVTPVIGDWDGDGIDTIGYYDAAGQTFYLRNSNSAGTPDEVLAVGIAGAPVAGKW